jgi:hypothetical protein
VCPTFKRCGGFAASRGQPTQTPTPAEAFAIGMEFQNFQAKRGAALASMSPVAASFA